METELTLPLFLSGVRIAAGFSWPRLDRKISSRNLGRPAILLQLAKGQGGVE